MHRSARLTANDPKAIDRMVLNRAGIAATARYMAAPEIEAGNLVRVLPDWSGPAVDVSLACRQGTQPGCTSPRRLYAPTGCRQPPLV
ncbi:hypothetical protein EB232_13585 [Mesorhizobium sp. NZP2077]|nr:hypothetical protein EB232_13585 [Mesorhizobium sp. NZP2077]QKD16006.1 hypothetical protein HGP13_13390 [Mesorhizobium sp. NZP2077]